MDIPSGSRPRPEVWGGVEPTVRRVGDEYFDQLERSGHASRLSDLDRFAELGFSRIRYPVLWERAAPDSLDAPDWRWSDERLGRLRELGIKPIVGLLHHGSGPRYTDLLDPNFPTKLASYARMVAERYPWVEMFTPVNEPLTTARFSCLYGFWYPHERSDAAFANALLNQAQGTVLAMRAIREVNPNAQLVQTEDLGKTYSTARLAYQARLENERRWATFDLLSGQLDRGRPMWNWLVEAADVPEERLEWFLANACPPDVLGVNTYVTSERLLVEEIEPYPEPFHGGNGRDRYSDIEAVRVSVTGMAGHVGLLREAWERYGRPIAVTEAQLASTREEQLRWIHEAWQGVLRLCDTGVDVRALTFWALLGSYEWNSLLTQVQGHYETGAFDVRSHEPRPTAVARMAHGLATEGAFPHPVLAVPGWWRRRERILYKPVLPELDGLPPSWLIESLVNRRDPQPILITGATGTLGRAFARICDLRALPYRLTTRQEMDVADASSVAAALDAIKPWAVVNTTGYVRVDEAEEDRERCFRENTVAADVLARECASRGIPLLTFSSDLAFDGSLARPYVESDEPRPLNVYGKSKAEAERLVLAAHPRALVVRTSAFFGPWDEHNFALHALRSVASGETFAAASDQCVSPTYVPDLVHTCLDLLIDAEAGIWHVVNDGAVSWAELARQVAERSGLDSALVVPTSTGSLALRAARPVNSALASERGRLMPPLESAVDRFLTECEVAWRPVAAAQRVPA